MESGRSKLQLYVDDPALSLLGTRGWALTEGSIPILWWLVLGLKLSWSKGYFGDGPHEWIGVRYDIGTNGPTMELPRSYLEKTLEQLKPLCASRGSIPVRQVQSALGKAARIAHHTRRVTLHIVTMGRLCSW